MFRWTALLTSFLLSFVFSLWVYIYLHRVEYTQLALAYAFPSSTVTVGEVSVHNAADTLMIKWDDIEIRPVYLSANETISLKSIEATIPYIDLVTWAFLPQSKSLHIREISLSSVQPLPPYQSVAVVPSVPSNFYMDIDQIELHTSKRGTGSTKTLQQQKRVSIRNLIDTIFP